MSILMSTTMCEELDVKENENEKRYVKSDVQLVHRVFNHIYKNLKSRDLKEESVLITAKRRSIRR